MNIPRTFPGRTILPLAAAALLVSGCREPGPVELVDDTQAGRIEVVTPPPAPMPGMELGDADSSGIVPLPPAKFFGHFLLAGARYDGTLSSFEVSLSRAILFDRSSPVELSAGRTSFRTLDAGIVALNGSLMLKVGKNARAHGMDTLLGPQYVLFNRLPGGFRYEGGASYIWAGTGNGAILPFTAGIDAPEKIVVRNLSPTTPVSFEDPLDLRWSGGGATVDLVIGVPVDQRVDTRPILHLRLGPNRGGARIPQRILALLPRDLNRFIFTFSSAAVATARIDGYPDDVLLQALTSHSILVQVRR